MELFEALNKIKHLEQIIKHKNEDIGNLQEIIEIKERHIKMLDEKLEHSLKQTDDAIALAKRFSSMLDTLHSSINKSVKS